MTAPEPAYIEATYLTVGDLFKDRSGRGPWRVVEARVDHWGTRCHKVVGDEKAIIQWFPLATLVEPVTL